MDYEKYNNALEKARVRYNEIKDTDCSEKKFLLGLFPELAESEDEKIRKAVIEMIHDTPSIECEENYNVCKNDILAWLEKQGEKKATDKVNPTLEDKVNILADKIIDLRLMVKALEIQAIRQCSDKNRLDSLESMVFQMSEIYKTPDKAGDNVTLKDMKS